MKIIAYGSLMNQASLEATLNRPAQLEKLVVPDVSRIFNASFEGYAYLNLQRDSNSAIEAAYFSLEPPELTNFALREAGSILIEVLPGYFAFTWPVTDIEILPVLQSYLDTCQAGAAQLNINMACGLITPGTIIDDRALPIYR